MTRPELSMWTADPPSREVRSALQRLGRDPDVRRIAVMPDVHLSKEVCVGVAVATRSTLIPAAVGGDIGCGMAAIGFDAGADLLADGASAARVLEALYEVVPIQRHARASAPRLPPELETTRLSRPVLQAVKAREGPLQFGTLGRGNHFVEFQADEAGRLWLMVHTGSRGLGQAIREAHEGSGSKGPAGLPSIAAESREGEAYLGDIRWALRFAHLSRNHIVDRVRSVMDDLFGVSADERTVIHCHHNFVRREMHEGEALWVHRKGVISARAGEPGIIPGSMGAPSHHVVGRGNEPSLCSSSHGAGRVMSRSIARRSISPQRLHASMQGIWFDHRHARRLVDEGPDAYKDIGAVMRAQRALTRSIRTLRPLLAFKGV